VNQIIQLIEKIKPFIRSTERTSSSISRKDKKSILFKKKDENSEEEELTLISNLPENSSNISIYNKDISGSDNYTMKKVARRIAINESIEGLPYSELAKSSAIEELMKKYPNAEIKETAIIRPWERKRIEKWSDNAKSFWNVWVTEETTVQVIAQVKVSICKLFTIHVERRINPTGAFSHCYSHIIFEDDLSLESNP
jgi:hypothetical protein